MSAKSGQVWIRLRDPKQTLLWAGKLEYLPRAGETLFVGTGQVYTVHAVEHNVASAEAFILVTKP